MLNIFHILGPVMIGPSSSHTGGAVRIGLIAGSLLGSPAIKARIFLHGSFAQTYKGHGTDKALAAGILGMHPDDEGIRTSLEKCAELGIDIEFIPTTIENAHPNTVLIELIAANGNSIELEGASIGGGNIQINKINGQKVNFSAQNTTIIIPHDDKAGLVAAITGLVAETGLNISNLSLSRDKKGGNALVTIEIDGLASPDLRQKILQIKHVTDCIIVKPI